MASTRGSRSGELLAAFPGTRTKKQLHPHHHLHHQQQPSTTTIVIIFFIKESWSRWSRKTTYLSICTVDLSFFSFDVTTNNRTDSFDDVQQNVLSYTSDERTLKLILTLVFVFVCNGARVLCVFIRIHRPHCRFLLFCCKEWGDCCIVQHSASGWWLSLLLYHRHPRASINCRDQFAGDSKTKVCLKREADAHTRARTHTYTVAVGALSLRTTVYM